MRICILLFFCIILAGGKVIDRSKDKVQEIRVQKGCNTDSGIRNIGYDAEVLNPLRKNGHADIERSVKQYFAQLLEKNKSYVKKYDEIQIYTKEGKFHDTYLVFAVYRMKIRGLYTKVPGLLTLYASRNSGQAEYQLMNSIDYDETDAEWIKAVMMHTDVQALLNKTKDDYRKAVRSDALLMEALNDLKRAYQNRD